MLSDKEKLTVGCQTKLSCGEFDKYVKEIDDECEVHAASVDLSDTEDKDNFDKTSFIY